MANLNTMLNPLPSGLILLLFLVTGSATAADDNIQLLSSIRPLQMLVYDLVGNDINHSTLLNAQQSPHHVQLKPSQRQRLQQASTVYWYGAQLEPVMAAILSGDQSLQSRAIDLHPDTPALEHDHDDHHINVHYWLDRGNALKAARAISDNIATTLPEKTDILTGKLQELSKHLQEMERLLESELQTARAKSYLDLHDAWELLAEDFNLPAFSSINHQALEFAGAKTVLNLRREIASGKFDCIIASPETNQRLVNNLVENSNARVVLLNALGNDLNNESGFTDFLTHNIRKLAAC